MSNCIATQVRLSDLARIQTICKAAEGAKDHEVSVKTLEITYRNV